MWWPNERGALLSGPERTTPRRGRTQTGCGAKAGVVLLERDRKGPTAGARVIDPHRHGRTPVNP